MKTPIPRERIDRKSGKIYWRVRVNNAEGKEVVRLFGTREGAEAQIKNSLSVEEHGGGEFVQELLVQPHLGGRVVGHAVDRTSLAVNGGNENAPAPVNGIGGVLVLSRAPRVGGILTPLNLLRHS